MIHCHSLTLPRQPVKEWLQRHPDALRATLIANHVLRTAPMAILMRALPCSLAANAALCASGSLFYALTVEGNCIYKFTLPSLFGAAAWMVGKEALFALISGVASASIGAFAAALLLTVPLAAWGTYVWITTGSDVEKTRTSCCCG